MKNAYPPRPQVRPSEEDYPPKLGVRKCWAIVDFEENMLIVHVGRMWPNGEIRAEEIVIHTGCGDKNFERNQRLWSEYNDWHFTSWRDEEGRLIQRSRA